MNNLTTFNRIQTAKKMYDEGYTHPSIIFIKDGGKHKDNPLLWDQFKALQHLYLAGMKVEI